MLIPIVLTRMAKARPAIMSHGAEIPRLFAIVARVAGEVRGAGIDVTGLASVLVAFDAAVDEACGVDLHGGAGEKDE
jgi:hypothetical protein